jgi:PIN domain nuclease of toxin-antitoxin system
LRLLLDTHALLWALAAPERLSRVAADALRDPASDVFVSAASTWEIAIKSALGKLTGDVAIIASVAQQMGFAELPVTVGHTLRVRTLDPHHRDPFDRMLVAQALAEGLTIVTRDPAFGAYDAPTLWS